MPVQPGPRAERVAQSDNYLGNITGLLKPEILQQLILQKPGEDMTFAAIMRVMGRERKVSRRTYSHDESGAVTRTLGVDVTVGPTGAGNPITWTIPAAQHGPGGQSYAIVGETVVNPTNEVQGFISAVSSTANANTVTVQPFSTTGDFGPVTAGQDIPVLTFAGEEGSDQPDSRVPDRIRLDHKVQIIKQTFETSGSSFASDLVWTTVKDNAGNTAPAWSNRGILETEMRFRRQINMAYLIQDPDNSATPTRSLMQGAIPFIQGNGTVLPYTVGSFGLTDLSDMIDALDAELVSKSEYMICGGLPLVGEFDDFIANLTAGGGIVYGAFNGKKELAVSMNFKSFSYKGYTFHMTKLSEFTNPDGLGVSGGPWPNYGMVIPMGRVATSAVGQANMCETTTISSNGYERGFEFFNTGSAGPSSGMRATETFDRVKWNWRCERGTWFKAGNQFGLFTPS